MIADILLQRVIAVAGQASCSREQPRTRADTCNSTISSVRDSTLRPRDQHNNSPVALLEVVLLSLI